MLDRINMCVERAQHKTPPSIAAATTTIKVRLTTTTTTRQYHSAQSLQAAATAHTKSMAALSTNSTMKRQLSTTLEGRLADWLFCPLAGRLRLATAHAYK